MKWEVEYTDEFESWWSSLTEEEQEDVAASVGLLEEMGPGSHIHIVQGFRGQSTVLCGSCAFNIRDAHTEFFTRSILAA